MYYAQLDDHFLCSSTPDLPGYALNTPPAQAEAMTYLFRRDPASGRSAFAISQSGQLAAENENVRWLDCNALPNAPIDALLQQLIMKGRLRAVNYNHPRWREMLNFPIRTGKKRLNLIALGDVGSTLLIGLRLMGDDVLHSIGIFDIAATASTRWEFELNQVQPPDGRELPLIEPITEEQLFDCDLLVFCATKGVPPLSAGGDVRMAQFQANRQLVAHYARLARARRFSGIFCVVSDPVDLLCRVAYDTSNSDANGCHDWLGLSSEQVEGFGLGVMNARAAYYARKDPRFDMFLREGAAYGPHGAELVIANSLINYDNDLSLELTALAVNANKVARANGFKPYVAPALSSAAYNLLAMLRGEVHLSATLLGDVFFGARSRRTDAGIELIARPLPPELMLRIEAADAALRQHYTEN